jgi:hypothetical protein
MPDWDSIPIVVVPSETGREDEFDFICQYRIDVPVVACKFTSREWPSEEVAYARGVEHMEEHRSKKPMQTLAEFQEAQGLGHLNPTSEDA